MMRTASDSGLGQPFNGACQGKMSKASLLSQLAVRSVWSSTEYKVTLLPNSHIIHYFTERRISYGSSIR
ncbi:MAG: hypothetical protein EPO24_15420 [Bacteroidetes bacterium]|nr:MAG: hypothetical protein EPO24_15420 [Bacteroidota bacterium]